MPKTLTIIQGVTVDGGTEHPYIGVGYARSEYRIYLDREGWFHNGEYTPIAPRGSTSILEAIERAGRDAFLEAMCGYLERWELKEKAGIR
jgi:hypothetical protein